MASNNKFQGTLPSLRKKIQRQLKESFRLRFRHASTDALLTYRHELATNPSIEVDFEMKEQFNSVLEQRGLEHYFLQ